MELTIFTKKRTTKEGKTFNTYFSTLTRKDGEEVSVSVKFKEVCGAPDPENCPLNILVTKEDCNLATKDYTNNDGLIATSRTLWVNKWEIGSPYVDHSLDDFDFS